MHAHAAGRWTKASQLFWLRCWRSRGVVVAGACEGGWMRVAVLSDIHGHLPALEAVLVEVDRAGVDRIVLTGDIASGPMPVPTLLRLLDLGERAVWVGGNGERELVDVPEVPPDPVVPWAAAQLTTELRSHMAGLPLTVTLDVDGLGPTVFCHATPRDDEEVVLVDSTLQRWTEVLAGRPEQTVVLGHTHMPFVRLVDRRLVVNPGSVGMPYGTGGAHWALLGPGVELRRTDYDIDAACATLAAHGYPGIEGWLDYYVRQTYSDAEALAVFGPRDGRTTP
jgi:predicted phosphodiesterase